MNQLSEISYYTKRAGHAGASQLRNQYNYIAELEEPLKNKFPIVRDLWNYEKNVEYRMEAIPYRTKLRDCLLGNPKDSFQPCLEAKDAIKVLNTVLGFALGDLATSKINDVPDDYLEKRYWGKYKLRLKETQDKIKYLQNSKTECLECPHLDYNREDIHYLSRLNKILKEVEAIVPVPDLSRQCGFGQSTFNKWKAK